MIGQLNKALSTIQKVGDFKLKVSDIIHFKFISLNTQKCKFSDNI